MGNAVIGYFQERLADQQVWAEETKENYQEVKLRWETTLARQEEYRNIIIEWIKVYDLEREVESDRFLVNILYAQVHKLHEAEEFDEEEADRIN